MVMARPANGERPHRPPTTSSRATARRSLAAHEGMSAAASGTDRKHRQESEDRGASSSAHGGALGANAGSRTQDGGVLSRALLARQAAGRARWLRRRRREARVRVVGNGTAHLDAAEVTRVAAVGAAAELPAGATRSAAAAGRHHAAAAAARRPLGGAPVVARAAVEGIVQQLDALIVAARLAVHAPLRAIAGVGACAAAGAAGGARSAAAARTARAAARRACPAPASRAAAFPIGRRVGGVARRRGRAATPSGDNDQAGQAGQAGGPNEVRANDPPPLASTRWLRDNLARGTGKSRWSAFG